MKPAGSASFLVRYRTPQGRTRRYAFAKSGTLTPDEARAKTRLLAEAGDGGDPSVARHKARKALTVAELRDRRLLISFADFMVQSKVLLACQQEEKSPDSRVVKQIDRQVYRRPLHRRPHCPHPYSTNLT